VRHNFIDRYANLDSPLHVLEARTKILGYLSLIAALLLMPGRNDVVLLVYAFVAAILVGASQVPLGYIVGRSLVILPFVLLAGIAAPWTNSFDGARFMALATRSFRVPVPVSFRSHRRGVAHASGPGLPARRPRAAESGIEAPGVDAGVARAALLRARRADVPGDAVAWLCRRVPCSRPPALYVARPDLPCRNRTAHRELIPLRRPMSQRQSEANLRLTIGK